MKIAASIYLLILSVALSSAQAACWDKREYRNIENYSELDDKLIISFKDAVSCKPLENVDVKLGKLMYQTDLRGYVTLPMAPFIQAGNLDMPMLVSKRGYSTIQTELKVVAGTILNKRLLLSPTLNGNSMRFILQWNDSPEDLDLHLEGNGFHISYRNKRVAGNARLDQDEQDGFGPETITLKNIEANDQYKVSVVNYSGGPGLDEAKVLVYVGDKLHSIIPLNETSSRKVDILKISNASIRQLQSEKVRPKTGTKKKIKRVLYPGW